MALTYQPFAQAPEVHVIETDLRKNVPDGERIAGAILGVGLAAAGLSVNGLTRWALLLLGGLLVRRSVTGHCDVYHHLELDKRHDRAGVVGNRGKRIEASVEILRSPEVLFRFWRDLAQLPRVMRHVQSVEPRGKRVSHWKVAGPAGRTFEWDAEIINEHENRLIAWRSLPGASVSNAGSVWFEPAGQHATRVKVALEFDPPAGSLGVAIAEMFSSSSEADLQEDLQGFKAFAERELLPPPGGA